MGRSQMAQRGGATCAAGDSPLLPNRKRRIYRTGAGWEGMSFDPSLFLIGSAAAAGVALMAGVNVNGVFGHGRSRIALIVVSALAAAGALVLYFVPP